MNKGDSIYLFSDGFSDQFGGPKGKKYKSGKLKELLISIKDNPMQQQGEKLDHEFEAWRGDLEQVDDVCILGIKI